MDRFLDDLRQKVDVSVKETIELHKMMEEQSRVTQTNSRHHQTFLPSFPPSLPRSHRKYSSLNVGTTRKVERAKKGTHVTLNSKSNLIRIVKISYNLKSASTTCKTSASLPRFSRSTKSSRTNSLK